MIGCVVALVSGGLQSLEWHGNHGDDAKAAIREQLSSYRGGVAYANPSLGVNKRDGVVHLQNEKREPRQRHRLSRPLSVRETHRIIDVHLNCAGVRPCVTKLENGDCHMWLRDKKGKPVNYIVRAGAFRRLLS